MLDTAIASLWGAVSALFTLWFGVGFVSTLFFSLFLSPYLFSKYVKGYRDLGKMTGDFNTRLSSTIHASVTFSVAAALLLFDPKVSQDKIFSPSRISECLMEYSLGYFLADYLIVLMDPVMRKDPANHAHHFVSFSGTALSRFLHHMVFFVIYRYTNELSTVFVNLFVVLHSLKMTNTAQYYASSFMMVASFFLVRIAVIPLHWYWIYDSFPDLQSHVHLSIKWYVFIVYPTFDVLNIIWFRKMVLGSMKLLKRKPKD